MMHSLSDINELWLNLLKDSALDEDLLTLAVVAPLGAFLSPDNPTPCNAVRLLWEYDVRVYQPTLPLSAQAKRGLLDCLDWMYEKYRVPYEPDSDDSEKLIDLAVELHVAAHRSLRIKQANNGQLSEEFIISLDAVERTMKRIKIAVNSIEGQLHSGNPTIAVSTDAIWAIVQVELSHVRRLDRNYAAAIHYLHQASGSYISALDDCTDDPLSDDGSTWRREDNAWIKSLKRANVGVGDESNAWKRIINDQLTPLHMPLAEAASLFNSLIHSPSDDLNWKQIAEDCAGLAYLPQLEWEVFSGVENQETIEDDEGFDVSWSEFWRHAEAWATAQLSPSEYRKMRNQDEKDAAERRLENYFFGSSCWPSLPDRAQQRLINADVNWNSPQRMSREAILNDLLRATEEMCHRFIWQLLENDLKTSTNLVDIEHIIIRQGRSEPNSRDYIRTCKRHFFKEFLRQMKIDNRDIRFMTKKLPKSMTCLTDARNTAEHDTGVSMSKDTVASFFNSFLGIGQPGILPQLARIGRKLQTSGK